MKEGDIIKTVKICKRRECEECGELAELKHTFMRKNFSPREKVQIL